MKPRAKRGVSIRKSYDNIDCIICGRSFKPLRITTICCDNPECKRQRKQNLIAENKLGIRRGTKSLPGAKEDVALDENSNIDSYYLRRGTPSRSSGYDSIQVGDVV